MPKKRNITYSYASKVISLLMVVFVLNLCVQVPVSQKLIYTQDSFGNTKIEKKTTRKLILQLAADYVTDSESSISDNASSNLLEELNEVKEDWFHHSHEAIKFQSYHTNKQHRIHNEPLFRFIEDARLFPPPEMV